MTHDERGARDEVELHWRPRTAIAAVVASIGAIALAAVGLSRSGWNPGVTAFVALSLASFGFVAEKAWSRLREQRPLLVFSPAGILDPTGIFMVGRLDWSMVASVHCPSFGILGAGLALGRVRIALRPELRRTTPLTTRERARLFLGSGSTALSINLMRGAVSGPPDWMGRLVEMSRDSSQADAHAISAKNADDPLCDSEAEPGRSGD